MNHILKTAFGTFTAVCLLASCQSARMTMPEALAGAERWPVQGRHGWKLQERLQFGPYAAVDIDRSWTRGRDLEIVIYESNRRRQRYSFTLNDADRPLWDVGCHTSLLMRTVRTPAVDVGIDDTSSLQCTLEERSGPARWTLTLSETRDRPLEGRLRGEAGTFAILGTTALDGGLDSSETSGYHIADSDGAVAAIEVVNSGSVVLAPRLSVEEQSLLSAAAAALLLIEELRGTMET